MELEITKTGAFLNNGNSVSFIKGINNVVSFINTTSNLDVIIEVENSNKFINLLNKINNANIDSVKSELIKYSDVIITFKFNFKTI